MVIAHPVPGKRKSVDICKTFIAGAPKDAVGHVFYGVTGDNAADWDRVRALKNEPWFYIDNSYFDSVRGQQYRVSKNRVQCQPVNQLSDGKRFAKLGLTIKPINTRASDKWLAIEQSPIFMRYVANDPKWLDAMVKLYGVDHKVTIRRWSPDKLAQQESLPVELADALTVLTHSSAAAVTATLEGILSIVSSMSALYRMRWSSHPEDDERQRYMEVLADNQWTLDEIKEGKAWDWLARS